MAPTTRCKLTYPGLTFLLVGVHLSSGFAPEPDSSPVAGGSSKAKGNKLGGDAWGFDDGGDEKGDGRHCRHGYWNNATKVCDCVPGWGTAHITDTIDFFEGVCEQYHCKSDLLCQQVLGIEGATCPVPNWNCYCGWKYAFMNGGHGFETQSKTGGGECMGFMYTISVSASMALEQYFAKAWFYALIISIIFFPFGRKRFNCDHHRPSLWNVARERCGCVNTCNGDCVSSPTSLDNLMDEFAWSFYILDLCAWSYLFFAVAYFVFVFLWSVILWTAVIVMTICLLVAALCMACGEGGGAAGAGDCGCNCCADGSMGCGDCCLYGGFHTGVGTGATDAFYFSGPVPYDPFWGYSGYGGYGGPPPSQEESCCSCCASLCRPIGWMLYYFPAMPENMWGGFIGCALGTRSDSSPDRVYRGGSAVIDWLGMGWRRRYDLHDDSSWRRQVYDFLASEANRPVRNSPSGGSLPYAAVPGAFEASAGNSRQFRIANTNVIHTNRAFDEDEDRCIASSFQDYRDNQCWICADQNDEWDMWLSCHHLFCKKCSSEMLRRRMPCPLCRVASSTVLRGLQCGAQPNNNGSAS